MSSLARKTGHFIGGFCVYYARIRLYVPSVQPASLSGWLPGRNPPSSMPGIPEKQPGDSHKSLIKQVINPDLRFPRGKKRNLPY